jgi:hypothetical protein
MKKFLCVFLTLALLLFSLSFSVSAQSGVTVQKENTNPRVGEEFVINVTLDAGRQVQAWSFTLKYDEEKLEFVRATDGSANDYESSVRYINTGNNSRFTASLVFKAKASGGTSINVTDVFAADTDEYYYSSVSFGFEVDNGLIGDADGNGVVNTSDLATLKLYLAGSVTEINNLVDFNNDTFIDTTDLASLKLHLAGG